MNILRTIFLNLIIVASSIQIAHASDHAWLTHSDLYKGGAHLFSRVAQSDMYKQATSYGSWLQDKAWEHRVPIAGCLLGCFVAKKIYDEHNQAKPAVIYNPAPKSINILPYQLKQDQAAKLLQALPAQMRYVATAKQKALEAAEEIEDVLSRPTDPAVHFLRKNVYTPLQERYLNKQFLADKIVDIDLPGQDCFVYVADINKQARNGQSIIKGQMGLDCGFHAVFNGIQLLHFTQGQINRSSLTDNLQNFDVNELKALCNESSYISSETIDQLMHMHNLTSEQYSIIESVETIQFTMDVIPKLACNLFDPNRANYNHILILNSQARDHWTVAVIHKSDGEIRVYTADSLRGLRGNDEHIHAKKILQLAAQAQASRPEQLETLYRINSHLDALADQHNDIAIATHLMYVLHDIYKHDCLKLPYFLDHFQQPLLFHLKSLEDANFTDNAQDILMLLSKAVRQSTLLSNKYLPKLDFTAPRNTEAEKTAFLILLDIYRIRDRLLSIEGLSDRRDSIRNEIDLIRLTVENQNAFIELEEAIKGL